MKKEHFIFVYPVTDLSTFPVSCVNLTVRAVATIGREGQVIKTEILSIVFFDGSPMATQIQKVIKAVSFPTYTEIEEAARQHAEDKFKKPELA